MKESLRAASLNRFKKNPSSYIAVGIFCGLFFILAATLSLIDVSFAMLAIPLIVLPFLFSSHVACYFLEANQPITISAISRYFFGFFRPQFRSSFRGIRSFLTSLAVYFGAMIVVYVFCYAYFKNAYGEVFTEAFKNISNIYFSYESSYAELLNAMNENGGMLLTFFIYVSTIPIPFALLWFIYSISFSSLSIYYRLNVRTGSPSLIRLAVSATYSQFKKKMRSDWFKLNWPVLVLSLIGSIAGGLISYFLIEDISFFPVIVTLGGVTLLLFFLPIYFANMEAMYDHYTAAFKDGNRIAVETILDRIQSSIDLSDEEKRKLEDSFREDDGEEQ
ncbi:MAG: hypothetical protein J6X50_03335 [Bacilli bacterium]|nr:hypothetical protein [Bacilli bacterium]